MDWSTCTSDGIATIDCVPLFIMNIIYWGILLAGFVAAIVVIMGGIRFLTSGGDPKKLDLAKKTIGFAVLGLVLLLLSFFVINFIGSVTGVACLNINRYPLSFGTCGT